ncbi:2-oxo acid dehydrogenase subunit E2 [Flavihumibacter sp. RY-1]|uniref:Dihydrolipoamide acetyltransferase component of pyruvate dehydrogenase complex n=1 Tax=Flavihumibacter fluminis TaxID=2909236 RepID=A0ABS9BI36_9BACT|nr:dihydrolipoamide acetyltransferase family protein [Flavihumibacter fluminis]MCF1714742.1 2-oxo acid dehydrogenase subunit E2 [Flavihumibacter fluminis]
MALVDLVMPKMGESIMEATVLKWLKNPGDTVKQDETVLEIATDKVDSEVPSTADGVIEEVLYQPNDVVPIGSVIARIRTNGAAAETSAPAIAAPIEEKAPEAVAVQVAPPASVVEPVVATHPEHTITGNGNRFYSPLVLNIAASEGVSMSELEQIPGTGNEGRVTKKDILQFVQNKKSGTPQPVATPVQQPVATKPTEPAPASSQLIERTSGSYGNNVEIIEMDRMRKLIADHMVKSKQISPHVTSFTEADVTNLVLWRDKVKSQFIKQEGTKITFTPLFIEAIVRCIKKYPLINSSVEGDRIIVKKDINIGMATALPSGNLIVPVIKNADQLNLVGLTKQVNTLADAARNNKLRPEDTQGGTFTLTNVGTFGSLMGTPIIPQPQVAILAVGAIKKRPVVIETEQGDSIAIRHMMYLSMSYDHRIIDGSLGATFLSAVARELEHFDSHREI